MKKLLVLLLLIILSIGVVLFAKELSWVLHGIVGFHEWLLARLAPLIGNYLLRSVVVLTLIPLLLALIPAFIYWIFKRRWLPEYWVVVWGIWLVLMALMVYR